MSALTSIQTAVRNVRITGHSAMQALSAFLRDTLEFLADHPLLVGVLVALAVVFFGITRPRVH